MTNENDKQTQLERVLKTLADVARQKHALASVKLTSEAPETEIGSGKARAKRKALPPLLDYETELLFLDAEDLLHEEKEARQKIETAFEEVTAGTRLADIHDDAPLKLEDAICLPELTGVFTVNPEFRAPSESFSIKTLRRAIDAGQLRVIRPNAKNLFTTRRFIREWLEACQGQKNPPTSSSAAPEGTNRVASLTGPSTSSRTAMTSTALDAALRILQEPKKPSTTTSSGSTPKR